MEMTPGCSWKAAVYLATNYYFYCSYLLMLPGLPDFSTFQSKFKRSHKSRGIFLGLTSEDPASAPLRHKLLEEKFLLSDVEKSYVKEVKGSAADRNLASPLVQVSLSGFGPVFEHPGEGEHPKASETKALTS